MEAADRIGKAGAQLTPAERRVAEVVLANPQLVAFGTVADLADRSGSGAATVVRLAGKLGFDGYTDLQGSIQRDLAMQLRPAAERIREPAAADAIASHLAMELDNVRVTLGSLDQAVLGEVTDHLADPARRVFVVSGDASTGVAAQFVGDLAAVRGGVSMIVGNDVAVRRDISRLCSTDVLVVVDLRRYDRWVVDAARQAERRGSLILAITDGVLSPLAAVSKRTLVVAAAGAGPFDSHVGTLALFNLLVERVADRLRSEATDRLDRAEVAWQEGGALTDR